jgi:small GTP-binding protein
LTAFFDRPFFSQPIMSVLTVPGAPDHQSAEDRVLKVLIVGDSQVGKTSLVRRLVDDIWSSQHRATVGVDFALYQCRMAPCAADIAEGFAPPRAPVKVQLWDLAGQDCYSHLIRVYVKGAHAAIVVIDSSNDESFYSCLKWKKELDARLLAASGTVAHAPGTLPPKRVPIMLVCNKSDLAGPPLMSTAMEEFLDQNGFCGHAEVSAKSGAGVRPMMNTLVRESLLRMQNPNRGKMLGPVDIGPPPTAPVMQQGQQAYTKPLSRESSMRFHSTSGGASGPATGRSVGWGQQQGQQPPQFGGGGGGGDSQLYQQHQQQLQQPADPASSAFVSPFARAFGTGANGNIPTPTNGGSGSGRGPMFGPGASGFGPAFGSRGVGGDFTGGGGGLSSRSLHGATVGFGGQPPQQHHQQPQQQQQQQQQYAGAGSTLGAPSFGVGPHANPTMQQQQPRPQQAPGYDHQDDEQQQQQQQHEAEYPSTGSSQVTPRIVPKSVRLERGPAKAAAAEAVEAGGKKRCAC